VARAKTLPDIENVRDLIAHLGGIPPERIRMHPLPGTATEKDLLRLVERDKILCELIDGVLVEKVMGAREGGVGGVILAHIEMYLLQNDVGATFGADSTMRLLGKQVRLPDVLFVRWEKLPDRCYPDEPIPDLAPDLAVEVLSEGNTPGEMERKRREYFLAGTSLVWLVDPKTRGVTVFTPTNAEEGTTLSEADALDGGDVLPGFRLPVATVFRRVRRTEPPAQPKKPRRKKGD
jgi:Uma2 family endonuclease